MTKVRLVEVDEALALQIPSALVDKYGLRDRVVLEEREDGLLIHAPGDAKLSWEETYREMAAEDEDWADWQNLHDEDLL
jgi:antitoxin MazE